MKILSAVLFLSLLLFQCCSYNKKPGAPTTATDSLINSGGQSADSIHQHATSLITKNGCLSCHKINQEGMGPSYDKISAKYPYGEGTIENLAHSIIHGSTGQYGLNVMPPHPDITLEDAKSMAAYILSLKSDTSKASLN